MKSITVDYSKRLAEEPGKGHNRWHESIAPLIEAAPGEEVEIQTRDAFDGQIGENTTMEDLRRCDLNRVHPLTGPVYVAGAAPGDLLEVEIRDMKPSAFGYTVQVPGFGFLRDAFPEPYIAKWRIKDGFAESADLRGVRIPDGSFVGVIGVAPSKALRETIQRREANLLGRGGMVLPPEKDGAVPAAEPIATEALRTIPPRENGGNLDIKQLSKGRPAHAAGLCRRRLVLGRRRTFRARRRRGLRYGDRDGRGDPGAFHGAQGRSRTPRHPLPALCP
jgi:formamidase